MADRVSFPSLRTPAERAVVADGALGTMVQAQDLSLGECAGLERGEEIRNVTRPDVLRLGRPPDVTT